MKRRNFLKLTSAASVLSLLPDEVFSLLNSVGLSGCPDVSGKKIVLIQLIGANDGINTLVPVNQYDLYANLRPTLKLENSGTNGFINLDTTLSLENQVGLHPAMTGFKSLYDSGLMRIIQGVGYPNMNKSHFKSTDLWLSGGDGTLPNFNYQSGWAGRFMENFYGSYLNANFPLGIQLGTGSNSMGFHGVIEHGMSVAISDQDNAGFYSVINGLGGTPPTTVPNSDYGEKLQYLIDLDASTNVYSGAISAAFNSGTNTVAYPQTDLADQLKTVARFISGGLETKVYLVKIGTFDTHEYQILAGASHLGKHAALLGSLSGAVNSFITDINNQNKGNDVLAMTFSEFGRKAAENASLGTDHGETAPMFIFGKSVTPGISGTNVNLSEATEENNYQTPTVQFDYRSVFSTVLQDWLGAKNTIVDAAFYDNNTNSGFANTKIPGLINHANLFPLSCYDDPPPPVNPKIIIGVVVFPNPCSDYITVNSAVENPIYSLTVFSAAGSKIHYVPNTSLTSEITISTQHLAIGFYNLKIETKKETFVKKIVVRR